MRMKVRVKAKNESESIDKIDDNVDTNNYFSIIDKTKSFEDQIETLKKSGRWFESILGHELLWW